MTGGPRATSSLTSSGSICYFIAKLDGEPEPSASDVVAYYDAFQPMDAMLRGPGFYKPKVTPPRNADVQTEFLCFLGREV